jgi:peptide deformylase
MLFRTFIGTLVEIHKYDYLNDKLYYEAIMNLKRNNQNKTKEK